jgi:hypothetical protein
MKLCVAPLLRSALVLVFLCHICMLRAIVIEYFFLLYIAATVVRAVTISTQQCKNPHPYHGCQGKHCILPQSCILQECESAVQRKA